MTSETDPALYANTHNLYRTVLTPYKQKWCNVARDYNDWFCIAYTELWEVGFNSGVFDMGPPIQFTGS